MKNKFCKAHNNQILDPNDNPLYLKGVGIGGWLLLEGYMIKSYQTLERPRRIKAYISSYVGNAYMEYFFEQWYLRFFQKKDIIELKKQGFNCIRIPIDYEFLFKPNDDKETLDIHESHFDLLDQIILECAKQGIYVILDLHAAPGGQTGTNIDNSTDDKPRLFMNDLYQKQTIYIWKELAQRYKNETCIAAYDLLNEPLPNWFSMYYEQLIPLYKEIIKEIRSVDPYHMITLEGVHWSTDLSIFTSLIDDNILFQFHKYWNNPDIESIKPFLSLRDKLNSPLFMGEGGENNILWYSSVFKLYQQLDISYAFWTYKKMDANNSIRSFKKPKTWDDFLSHQLSEKQAKEVLDELLDEIQFEKTQAHQNVINHILLKDNYTLPAYAFDYEQKECMDKEIIKKTTSMRSCDGYKIANINGEIINPNFRQYNGEQVPDEALLYLFLQEDQKVNYTFEVPVNAKIKLGISCDNNQNLKTYINKEEVNHENGDITVVPTDESIILTIKALKTTRLKHIEFITLKEKSHLLKPYILI